MTPNGNSPGRRTSLAEPVAPLSSAVAGFKRLEVTLCNLTRLASLSQPTAPSRESYAVGTHVQNTLRAVSIPPGIKKVTGSRLASHRGARDLRRVLIKSGAKAPGGHDRNRPPSAQAAQSQADEGLSLLNRFVKFIERLEANRGTSGRLGRREQTSQHSTLSAAYARFLYSLSSLGQALIAPVTPVLVEALDLAAIGVNRLTRAVKYSRVIAESLASVLAAGLTLVAIGALENLLKDARRLLLTGGERVLRIADGLGVRRALLWLSGLALRMADLAAMLADISLGLYLIVGGIVAAAVASYELYKHWDAVKRLASEWATRAREMGARLLASTRATLNRIIANLRDDVRGLGTTLSGTLAFARSLARPTRNLNRSRPPGIPSAATFAPRAFRRAAAAATLAAPLMLASTAIAAVARPPAFAAPREQAAAASSDARSTRAPIAINYSPNVTIHAQDRDYDGALAQRVMEVLERHGRDLHEVLARELVRRQRTEF